MGNGRVSRGFRSGAVHGDFLLPRPLGDRVQGPVDGLGHEWSAISKERFKSSGVSVEPPEEAKKFLDRVMRDCQWTGRIFHSIPIPATAYRSQCHTDPCRRYRQRGSLGPLR